jgi:hypothetical protein
VCDGERIPPGEIRYDTRWFYQRHPEWSVVGKNVWDIMRAVDFLHTLDFIDTSRIACTGEHNYPPLAKRFSFAWLDRWFHHTPAVPSIWPNQAL